MDWKSTFGLVRNLIKLKEKVNLKFSHTWPEGHNTCFTAKLYTFQVSAIMYFSAIFA